MGVVVGCLSHIGCATSSEVLSVAADSNYSPLRTSCETVQIKSFCIIKDMKCEDISTISWPHHHRRCNHHHYTTVSFNYGFVENLYPISNDKVNCNPEN